ncbi:MAG TPA: ElyC/SanA/YdcF family protein [Bacteroidia bacterium]|jgi:SanA protein|nr:ElyC/SanA/YdcF family protein [Bacteroidia bacterium]
MNGTSFLSRFFKNRFVRWTALLFLLLFTAVLLCNFWVSHSTRSRIYSDVQSIPENEVALLLGTSKNEGEGYINLFFKYRIQAAAALYKAGKIHAIIVSGDNHMEGYDEATDMRDALMALGVPEKAITLDYAGFRTLDSVVRCKKVFGADKITIISQKFHNQRALFIASSYGMDAVAFNAQDVPAQYALKTSVREYFARFKAVLDLYVLHTAPKFLGEHEHINKP